jgi:hypothetical protein
MLYILLELVSFFDKTTYYFFKMLSLEQRIYLIQCWTSFLRLTMKCNANVEIIPRQLLALYTALNSVRADLFHFSANSLS